MALAAQSRPATPLIAAADGGSASASSKGINEWLSDQPDHPVTLWPLLPADQLDHHRRGAPDTEDFEQALRTVFGRLPDEPLPDLGVLEELLEFESPPGTYFDTFPISVMSQQSLNTMNHLEGELRVEVRRFRPNLLVDVPATDHPFRFPEQAWVGKLSIDTVKLKIEMTCPRCYMITLGFYDLSQTAQVLCKLVAASEGNLGVYVSMVQTNIVSAGDSVSLA